MNTRLFTLPRDVFNTSVLNHLPTIKDRKSALVAKTTSLEEAQQRYAEYLGTSLSTGHGILNFIAGLNRADIAWLLQQTIGKNSALQTALQDRSMSSAADYAVYALISNVMSLDVERLQAAILELRAQGCSARLLNSLALICAYRNHEGLAECLKSDVAYINFCGASLEGVLKGVDLSYADFTGAMFGMECTMCNLESANFTGANFMDSAKIEACNTKGMIVTDARLAMGFVLESTEIEDGLRRLDVPELEPLIVGQRVNVGHSTNLDRRQNGCSVM